MKIGIVSVWADCGAGYVSRAYAQVLEQRHSVQIYARGTYLSGRGDPFWDTPNVTWDSGTYGMTRINRKQYCDWLKKNKIELVLFNEQRWWQVVIATRRMGIATVAYVDYYTSETVPLFRLFDALICNTYRHFSVFKDHPGAHYIPWGTDTGLFAPGPRWGKPQEEVIFFHSAGHGGTNDRKGTGVLLEAFQQVKGPARLFIHSQIPTRDLPDPWQMWIQSNPNIQVLEGTVKPPGLYQRGDVYVYPTRLEGIGLSLIEALACGLPAITTDQPPMNEFVREGINGSLAAIEQYLGRFDGYYWPETPCPVSVLARCMQQYVDQPALVVRQQLQTRAAALRELDWQKNAAQLPQICEEMCKPARNVAVNAELGELANRLDAYHEPSPTELLGRAARLSVRQLKSEIKTLLKYRR